MSKVMEELLHDRIVEVRKEGVKEGRQEGRISLLAELVRDGVMSISDAAKKMGLSEAAFKKMAVL